MRTKKVSITSNIIIAAKLAIKTDNITPFGGRYSVFNRFRETRCSPGRLAGQTWKGAAKKLLKESKLSMAEIAEQVGYSTARYFSARFKIHTGVSPLAYRKKRLKGL